MTSCYTVSQLRPLALCIQGLPLGYRSVFVLARGEAEGLIYTTRSSLKERGKLPLLHVVIANHHREKDTRSGPCVCCWGFSPLQPRRTSCGCCPRYLFCSQAWPAPTWCPSCPPINPVMLPCAKAACRCRTGFIWLPLQRWNAPEHSRTSTPLAPPRTVSKTKLC